MPRSMGDLPEVDPDILSLWVLSFRIDHRCARLIDCTKSSVCVGVGVYAIQIGFECLSSAQIIRALFAWVLRSCLYTHHTPRMCTGSTQYFRCLRHSVIDVACIIDVACQMIYVACIIDFEPLFHRCMCHRHLTITEGACCATGAFSCKPASSRRPPASWRSRTCAPCFSRT